MAESSSARAYQAVKPYLFSVAYRMTGSASDAEDLIQDAWVRYIDAGSPAVESLRAYLTTTISRLAVDYLKSARVQREQYLGPWMPEPVLTRDAVSGPAEQVERREAVSMALLLLLEQLSPEQRVVYVLREGFELRYEEIAAHAGKSVAACRQLFHRATAKLDAGRQSSIAPGADHLRIVERFLAAFASGDLAGLTNLLARDVTWISDGGPNRLAIRRPIVGVSNVARGIAGFVNRFGPVTLVVCELAEINGATGIVIRAEGAIDQVFTFDIRDGQIATVRATRNLDKLRHIDHALGGGSDVRV